MSAAKISITHTTGLDSVVVLKVYEPDTERTLALMEMLPHDASVVASRIWSVAYDSDRERNPPPPPPEKPKKYRKVYDQ